VLDGSFFRDGLEDPALAVLNACLPRFHKIKFISGCFERFEQSRLQLLSGQTRAANADDDLRRVLKQRRDSFPSFAQKLPVTFNATMPVILILVRSLVSRIPRETTTAAIGLRGNQ
jgi:hypothetical protein